MILSIILTISFFIWVIILEDDPTPNVILYSLSVPNFQILDSHLVADWVARFTISASVTTEVFLGSPIFVDFSFFERIGAFVSYKKHILAVNATNIEQEKWEVIGDTTMSIKFSTKGLEGNQTEVKDWVLEDIRKDRDNGAVIFGLDMVIWTRGYTQSYWARCSNLMIDFTQAKWVATCPRVCREIIRFSWWISDVVHHFSKKLPLV